MVILRSQNKITDFLKILAWASPFNLLIDYTIYFEWHIILTYIFLLSHISPCLLDDEVCSYLPVALSSVRSNLLFLCAMTLQFVPTP